MKKAELARDRKTPRGGRRRARELALQGLYQWLVGGQDAAAILTHLAESDGYGAAEQDYVEVLLRGAIGEAPQLREALAPCLDRAPQALSPVEHAVLLIGAYELVHRPEIPRRVVINEAIEIAKAFGGTDGHRYVNGVLDRFAAKARPAE
ncbi:MAG: transcription antitermination factor NusB [Burkholderiales bacterium]